MDWVIPEVLCVKQGGYGGRARYILKDNIKFVPLYGWYLGLVSPSAVSFSCEKKFFFLNVLSSCCSTPERWDICEETSG